MKPRTDPDPVLEGEPRVALAPLAAARRPDPAALDPERPDPARVAVEAARRQQGVEEAEAERGLDGRGPEVALDPVEDRVEADELARRVEIEQAVDEVRAALDDAGIDRGAARGPRRSPPGSPAPGRRSASSRSARPLLAAAALAAADGAAVVLADRSRDRAGARPASSGGRRSRSTSSIVERSGRTSRSGVTNSSPTATFRLDWRRGEARHRLERRIEVAEVRRPEDELGEEAGQRRRLEADGAALAVDRGPGDPAAATVEVEDDVAGAGVASIRAATSPGGGGGASRSKNGSEKPGSARTSEARPAIDLAYAPTTAFVRRRALLARPRSAAVNAASGAFRRDSRRYASIGLVELFLEGLVGRRLRRQDAVEVLDLLVLLVVLEVVLELHLLADERALRVGPEVGRLGGRREARPCRSCGGPGRSRG